MATPGHVHSWRQHCPDGSCGWRRCLLCGVIQNTVDGHLIDGPKPPLKKEAE